jgi:hypothetical protein
MWYVSQRGPGSNKIAGNNSRDSKLFGADAVKGGLDCGRKAAHVVNPDQGYDYLQRLGCSRIAPMGAQRIGWLELRTNSEIARDIR